MEKRTEITVKGEHIMSEVMTNIKKMYIRKIVSS